MVNRDPIRRGGRVVEGAALEMLFRGNSNEGSNPSLSVLRSQSEFRITSTLSWRPETLFFGQKLFFLKLCPYPKCKYLR